MSAPPNRLASMSLRGVLIEVASRVLLIAVLLYIAVPRLGLWQPPHGFWGYLYFLSHYFIIEEFQPSRRVKYMMWFGFLVFYNPTFLNYLRKSFMPTNSIFDVFILLFVLSPLILPLQDPLNTLSAINSNDDPPKAYPHWDRVLGLDLFIRTITTIRNCTYLPAVAERHEKYGETYTSVSLGETVINTIDPENLLVIYGENSKANSNTAWGVEPMRFEAMEPFCGSSFITRDGRPWAESRAEIRQVLSKAHVEDFEGNGLLESLEQWVASLPENETVDVTESISNLFLDSAGRLLFGINLTSSGSTESVTTSSDESTSNVTPQEFLTALQQAERWAGMRMVFGIPGRILSNLVPSWKTSIATVHSFLNHQITQAAANDSPLHPTPLATFLAHSIPHSASADPLLLDTKTQHAQNTILQGFMATQDTTSVLLSNTLFLLSRAPDVWRALRAEALSLPTPLSARAIREAPLLNNILHESLRLYPPFAMLHRHALRATTLPRGAGARGQGPVFVPRGTRVTTCTYALHRREGIFGRDPNVFRPERWDEIKPRPNEFMAFSFGPRSCAGKEKARLEAGLVLVVLARGFERLESRDEREWMGMSGLSVKNKNGCLVAFVKGEGGVG